MQLSCLFGQRSRKTACPQLWSCGSTIVYAVGHFSWVRMDATLASWQCCSKSLWQVKLCLGLSWVVLRCGQTKYWQIDSRNVAESRWERKQYGQGCKLPSFDRSSLGLEIVLGCQNKEQLVPYFCSGTGTRTHEMGILLLDTSLYCKSVSDGTPQLIRCITAVIQSRICYPPVGHNCVAPGLSSHCLTVLPGVKDWENMHIAFLTHG